MTHPPMDCDDVVRQAWDWLDGELDRPRWEQIEQHLSTCTGCTEHVAFARTFLDKVRAAEVAPADLGALRERVRAALRR